MAARSRHFRAMLDTDMLEARARELTVKGVPPDVFLLVLEFLYTGSVDLGMSPELACDVLRAANLYQLPELSDLAQVRSGVAVEGERRAPFCLACRGGCIGVGDRRCQW